MSVDEAERAGEEPTTYITRIVDAKLRAALQLGSISGFDALLVADTMVVVAGQILQKPRDDADAASMLRRLSRRTHEVTTRFAIALPSGVTHAESVTTEVVFRTIADDELAWYVATGEGRDKAGSYAIQGRAAAFVSQLRGSYGAVVGLPSCEVSVALRRLVQAARHSDSS